MAWVYTRVSWSSGNMTRHLPAHWTIGKSRVVLLRADWQAGSVWGAGWREKVGTLTGHVTRLLLGFLEEESPCDVWSRELPGVYPTGRPDFYHVLLAICATHGKVFWVILGEAYANASCIYLQSDHQGSSRELGEFPR